MAVKDRQKGEHVFRTKYKDILKLLIDVLFVHSLFY